MKLADQFQFPCQFTGTYPSQWAGYAFLQPTNQNALHPGIDWNRGDGETDYGDPVLCMANGIVVHTSEEKKIGYGTICVVKHSLTDQLSEFLKSRYGIEAKTLYSFYAHLKDVNIRLGQELSRGDLLGWIGKSGTTVSHLHQELYKPIPGSSWRYWPTLSEGWNEARLRQYYVDSYDFIVNQPAIFGEDELTKCRMARDGHWNDLDAVKKALMVVGDYSLTKILARIETLIGFEVAVGEKEKEIKELNEQMAELKRQLAEKTEQLLELKKTNKEIGGTIEAAKVVNDDVDKKIDGALDEVAKKTEELDKSADLSKLIEPMGGWKLIYQGIRRLFGK